MFTEIKAGYRVTITSWENDADNYNTKSIDGLTENEVRFLKPLCEILKSGNGYYKDGCFGNMYDPSDSGIENLRLAVIEVVNANLHLTNDPNWKEILEENEGEFILDYYMDIMYDLGLTCGQQYTRVLEKFTVEYIPETIRIEIVTDKF